jgi:hypothetical protein
VTTVTLRRFITNAEVSCRLFRRPLLKLEVKMAKERRTRSELEEIVFTEVRKVRECEGVTGVTVRGVADERFHNWEVSWAHNATPMCEGAIEAIVDHLHKQYDMGDDV